MDIGVRTLLVVLAGNLGHSIADFVADGAVDIGGEGLKKLLADDGSLVLGKGNEEVDAVAPVCLALLRGDAAEEHGGKGADLQGLG